MFAECSNCCAADANGQPQEGDPNSLRPPPAAPTRSPRGGPDHRTNESVRSQVVDEQADRSRAIEIDEKRDREWVAVTAYQPIDTVVKTVEVPVVKTVETYVPKVTIQEKVVEVPKYIPEYVEKVVEVPELRIVDKIIEVPQYQYQYKYVPSVETKENVVHKPVYETKYIEKVVEVPQIKEVVRYQEVETIEEVIRYVPKGQRIPDEWKTPQTQTEEATSAPAAAVQPEHPVPMKMPIQQDGRTVTGPLVPGTNFPAYPEMPTPSASLPSPRVEQVFQPKVVKNVEIQKHVPISVDVPVPYMVPKPVVVPVQVPVLKFRDHFVPVPVRRRVIPRIRWTNEVYEVECIKEKPFLQVQDVIKPVPCDVEIKVHEFVEKASPINPTELSQADIHAMWMRVNADLAEKRKEELGDNYPHVRHPEGTVFGKPGCSQDDADAGSEGGTDPEARKADGTDPAAAVDPISLHPGHPLSMTYLQNQWMKKDTTATHEMYTPEWFEAHQKALHGLTMQNPTQIQLSPEQAAQLQPEQQAFGEAPWMSPEEVHRAQGNDQPAEPNPDASCCGSGTC